MNAACKAFLKRTCFFTAAIALAVLVMGQQVTGVEWHEYAATIFIVFIIWHLKDNTWFFKDPLSGLGAYAAWRTFIAAGLLVSFAAVVASGIVISQYVFAFMHIPGASVMRGVHNTSTAYFILFGGAHAGLHAFALLGIIKDNLGRSFERIFIALTAVMAAYGLYTLCTYEMYERLTYQVGFGFFDYDRPLIYFFVDTVSQFTATAFVSAVVSRSLLMLSTKD